MAFFEPTSSERRGLIVLCAALLLAIGVGLYTYQHRENTAEPLTRVPGNTFTRKHRKPQYYAVPERELATFDFDPNTADSTMLLRLGFAPFQVRGIYKYRAMGGRYHEVADVQRIPGMTNELWDRIASHIRIDRKYQYVTPAPRTRESQAYVQEAEHATYNRDTLRYPAKLRPGEVVELNGADTTMLKKIPGIGSYYARRIVRYRSELGGFASAEQLQEIDGIPSDIAQWVSVDASQLRKIDVNHATKSQLIRHPYLRAYRAGDIWQYRHNFGPITSLDVLRQLPNFTSADIQRLAPYLEFR